MRWAVSIGIFTFAIGGVLLLFAFRLVNTAFQPVSLNNGNLINGLAFGFLGFLLLGFGLYLFIEDATSKR